VLTNASSSSISELTRKSGKSKNEAGDPIRLTSKLLAVVSDPFDQGAVYVAEAAGTVKRIVLEVSFDHREEVRVQRLNITLDKNNVPHSPRTNNDTIAIHVPHHPP
jgi:hypothetical protein